MCDKVPNESGRRESGDSDRCCCRFGSTPHRLWNGRIRCDLTCHPRRTYCPARPAQPERSRLSCGRAEASATDAHRCGQRAGAAWPLLGKQGSGGGGLGRGAGLKPLNPEVSACARPDARPAGRLTGSVSSDVQISASARASMCSAYGNGCTRGWVAVFCRRRQQPYSDELTKCHWIDGLNLALLSVLAVQRCQSGRTQVERREHLNKTPFSASARLCLSKR